MSTVANHGVIWVRYLTQQGYKIMDSYKSNKSYSLKEDWFTLDTTDPQDWLPPQPGECHVTGTAAGGSSAPRAESNDKFDNWMMHVINRWMHLTQYTVISILQILWKCYQLLTVVTQSYEQQLTNMLWSNTICFLIFINQVLSSPMKSWQFINVLSNH